MKRTILLLMFFVFEAFLSAFSPRQEYLIIENFSSDELTIIVDFVEVHTDSRWQQAIQGIDVNITDYFKIYANNKVKAGIDKEVVSYYPAYGLTNISYYLPKLQEIPLEVKLKDIFKTFTITDSTGKIIVTLDTIDSFPATIEGDKIILEIYDKQK